jgi:hypothetical protein
MKNKVLSVHPDAHAVQDGDQWRIEATVEAIHGNPKTRYVEVIGAGDNEEAAWHMAWHGEPHPQGVTHYYIVNSNPNEDGAFDIIDDKGRHVCEAMLCEDHQIVPSISTSENIPESSARLLYVIDADLYQRTRSS